MYFLFIIGQPETTEMKLRAILAQVDYHHCIISWSQKGILFQAYMYVPEINTITGYDFHEREDEGHVLKVLYSYIINVVLFQLIHHIENGTKFARGQVKESPFRTIC